MPRLSKPALIFLLLVSGSLALAGGTVPENSPRALVHLLDYLAQDYGGAVAGGKVISKSEYQEQLDFSSATREINGKLAETKKDGRIATGLDELHRLIVAKSSPEEVSALAQKIKNEVIQATGLEVAPSLWPDLKRGYQLFAQKCVSCHGANADGKGPAASALNPPPANLRDSTRMSGMAPLQVFNTIRIGVPGTAMAPFLAMTDQDAWALSFYVKSILYGTSDPKPLPPNLSTAAPLDKIATLNDGQLEKLVRHEGLVALRTHSGGEDFRDSLQVAGLYLDQAMDAYKNGDRAGAKNKALMAYLEGVEPVEPRLKASDPSLVADLEGRMGAVRAAVESGGRLEDVLAKASAAREDLKSAAGLLNQGTPSPWLTFMIAAAILLREGFEAVLIIIALLGVVKAAGSKEAAFWIHVGWAAALGCGFLAWIFSGWLMGITGAQREMMEGVTSVIAVVVLLYMGFWLHRTTEIGRWTAFINGRVKTALAGKKLIGLSAISFIAVFREALETVLFLRALWLEGGMGTKSALASGVFGALGLIFILSWLFLKYAAKIPIRKLFDFSSSLMTVLAVILAGKGLHSLQEIGAISITASPLNFRAELIGFYPTLETSFIQLVILFLAVGLWRYGKRPAAKKVVSTVAQ